MAVKQVPKKAVPATSAKKPVVKAQVKPVAKAPAKAAPVAQSSPANPNPTGKMASVKYVPTADLTIHKLNKGFKQMDEGVFDDLVADIKKRGVRNPIVVTSDMEVVAGRERLRAAKKAKLVEVPVIVKKYKDDLEVATDIVNDNRIRKQFPKTELVEMGKFLEAQVKDSGEVKMGRPTVPAAAKAAAPGAKYVDKTPRTTTNKVVAKKLGVSTGAYERAKQAVKVPVAVQKRLDAGDIPIDLSIQISKLSPELQKKANDICAAQGKDKKMIVQQLRTLIEGVVPKDQSALKVVKAVVKLQTDLFNMIDKQLATVWSSLEVQNKIEVRQAQNLCNKRIKAIREAAGEIDADGKEIAGGKK